MRMSFGGRAKAVPSLSRERLAAATEILLHVVTLILYKVKSCEMGKTTFSQFV